MTPRRALVTRPLAQALDWCERLRALGVDAQALPLIDIAASPEVRAHFESVYLPDTSFTTATSIACTRCGTGFAFSASPLRATSAGRGAVGAKSTVNAIGFVRSSPNRSVPASVMRRPPPVSSAWWSTAPS